MEFTGERFVPNSTASIETEIEHLQRYYSILDIVRNGVILDAACGEGYGVNLMADHAKFVFGIDIDTETIEHALSTYEKNNVEFLNASVTDIPLKDHSVDIVVSFETIEHIGEHEQHLFLKEITRVLKKSGILIISTPNKLVYSDQSHYQNPFHVKEFYQEEFENFLSGYFKYVDLFYQKAQINYVINCFDNQLLEILPSSETYNPSGKYFIAICGNKPNKQNISSIILDENHQYEDLLAQLIQIQHIAEKRDQKIKKLQLELEEKNKLLNQLTKKE
ncbi:class I SAM-dependent methyltransferase [Heyndrickxia ginsengihumi]|uniref:Class I SAM-dependent methyltransferase n=1 Tax=Heyndrickxia ginsengihumi TaxID=363870 RepID=A0A0A6VHR5_9BACI|nr:class I SAM-dependent methyltransferase [Heyndrickxia ginsengihumi]KHD86963.1 hypothetical protein NG54_00935 [Heyndrickxia ginsengihumi]MBE6182701.1 class I SAM-dependent methyltransferase [Bacillus sp. (in: firmicutes)]MCM3021986.1 class I SAM-dependent methyltransferase [Heyndrickxia ginsengihumi]NEY20901.1 class I SAM-dependent methyltransferase [Heyndrickxia ginsengihumi]